MLAWTHAKRLLVVALGKLAAATYLMSLLNCVADDRAAAAGPQLSAILPDIGFDAVPEYQALYPLIDVTAAIQYALILWHTLSTRRLEHLAVFVELHAIILLLRCTTVPVTILPTFYPCKNAAANDAERTMSVFVRPFLHFANPSVFMSWCNDFIFSGHVSLLVLGSLALVQMRAKFALQAVSHCNVVVGVLLLLTTRSHYTVDIVLAVIIVCLLFETQKHRFHPLPDNKLNM